IRLVESDLRQFFHHAWSGESLCQENNVGMFGVNLLYEPLPETERFGMGIIHTKNPDPVLNPKIDYTLKFLPKVFPIFRLEIYRKYILVFFRGIFRVLDGPIGPPLKPVGMFFYIRMVGRALDGKV